MTKHKNNQIIYEFTLNYVIPVVSTVQPKTVYKETNKNPIIIIKLLSIDQNNFQTLYLILK